MEPNAMSRMIAAARRPMPSGLPVDRVAAQRHGQSVAARALCHVEQGRAGLVGDVEGATVELEGGRGDRAVA
jgi:hypothetical protein